MENEIQYYDEQATEYRRTLIEGDMGAGKTTLASTWPSPYFMDSEKNVVLRKKHIPFMDIGSTDKASHLKIEQVLSGFRDQTEPYNKFKTIVFDTVSTWADMMILHIQKKLGQDPLAAREKKTSWGEHWNILKNMLKRIMAIALDITNANVIFICHVQIDKVFETGEIIGGYPEVLGSFRTSIGKFFNDVIYMEKREHKGVYKNTAYTIEKGHFKAKSQSGLPAVTEYPTYEKLYGGRK